MTISNPGQQMLFETSAHPVVAEMMAQPILVVGTLYCFLLHVVVESPDHCAWLAGNFQSKVLFETKHSEAAGETTAVQIRNHPSQEKFFDFLGKRKFPSYFDR